MFLVRSIERSCSGPIRRVSSFSYPSFVPWFDSSHLYRSLPLAWQERKVDGYAVFEADPIWRYFEPEDDVTDPLMGAGETRAANIESTARNFAAGTPDNDEALGKCFSCDHRIRHATK